MAISRGSKHPEDSESIPRHVAIVMDGNGRWAVERGRPRQFGHQAGARAARTVIEESARRGIKVLTLFAFSSENWRRPKRETSFLMELFFRTLKEELASLSREGIVLRIIGDRQMLPTKLRQRIEETETALAGGSSLILQVALSYGGRWDITQAARRMIDRVAHGELLPEQVDEETLAAELSFADLPEVDLFIRTGGELRLSNFILWQAAYAELYFSPILWPDFDASAYAEALSDYARRQRRFGKTGSQLEHEPR